MLDKLAVCPRPHGKVPTCPCALCLDRPSEIGAASGHDSYSNRRIWAAETTNLFLTITDVGGSEVKAPTKPVNGAGSSCL